jgi:hypothetical protein
MLLGERDPLELGNFRCRMQLHGADVQLAAQVDNRRGRIEIRDQKKGRPTAQLGHDGGRLPDAQVFPVVGDHQREAEVLDTTLNEHFGLCKIDDLGYG